MFTSSRNARLITYANCRKLKEGGLTKSASSNIGLPSVAYSPIENSVEMKLDAMDREVNLF